MQRAQMINVTRVWICLISITASIRGNKFLVKFSIQLIFHSLSNYYTTWDFNRYIDFDLFIHFSSTQKRTTQSKCIAYCQISHRKVNIMNYCVISMLPNKMNSARCHRIGRIDEIERDRKQVIAAFFTNHNHSTHPSICAQFQIKYDLVFSFVQPNKFDSLSLRSCYFIFAVFCCCFFCLFWIIAYCHTSVYDCARRPLMLCVVKC